MDITSQDATLRRGLYLDATLGSRMRYARELKKLSQAELAVKSGISKGAISMSERDLTNLTVDNLGRICRILQVSADYLVFGRSTILVGDDWEQLMTTEQGVGLRQIVQNLHANGSLEQIFLTMSKLLPDQLRLLTTMAEAMAAQNVQATSEGHGDVK